MNKMQERHLYIWLLWLTVALRAFGQASTDDARFVTYVADPASESIRLYWKDAGGKRFANAGRLRTYLAKRNQKFEFAMNGGMYTAAHAPQGLYIEEGKERVTLDTAKGGNGNFYLKPNGVFYLTRNGAGVVTTQDFKRANVRFATQSGPMLVVDGAIHPAFSKGSQNLNIRNGVGILPDGRVLFAMSKEPINFYDFASFFQRMGCRNALYLDGFVSRTYYPDGNWVQEDGDFGVIIGVTHRKKR